MKHKIIGIVICTLLITSVFTVSGTSINNLNHKNNILLLDQLDQRSSKMDKPQKIGSSGTGLAQSFIPTLPTLTRVKLALKSTGSAEFQYYFVHIKKTIEGSTLTSTNINRNILEIGTGWYEFDFPDISVTPGGTYYIIVEGVNSTGDTSSVYWWYGYPDPYANGAAYYKSISGWNYLKDGVNYCDYCFETYGTTEVNDPPNKPVCSYDLISDALVVTATDPDGDQIRYGVDWNNDLTIDQWTSMVPSGTEQRINRDGKKGIINMLTEDEHGAQSGFVSATSKLKQYIYRPFQVFLENHLYLFPIYQKLLNKLV
ncbi:Uncharacterised protein [uncultured archaeon]|nr:Uncharacterised protein [uncultured archaeon]